MAVEELVDMVRAIRPFDDVERDHRSDVLSWLDQTDDVYRRISPSTPPKHLVTYFLVRDPTSGSVLLVEHRKAGKWLPTGGHVEPGERPDETVRREALEELRCTARFATDTRTPQFVTVETTVGAPETRHVDVTLWFLLLGEEALPVDFDENEFTSARWWTRDEVERADADDIEPHLVRFLAKLDSTA